jgi:hypothetical protein
MKEWSKDQEEYTEGQFREIEEKKTALKSQAEVERKKQAEIERQTQQEIQRKRREDEEENSALKLQALKRKEVLRREEAEFESLSREARERDRKKSDEEILNAGDEGERLRHERSLEIERLKEEEVRKEIERNKEESDQERKSRRVLEWLTKRFQLQAEWKKKFDPLKLQEAKMVKELKEVEVKKSGEPMPYHVRMELQQRWVDLSNDLQDLRYDIQSVRAAEERELRDQEREYKERWSREDRVRPSLKKPRSE